MNSKLCLTLSAAFFLAALFLYHKTRRERYVYIPRFHTGTYQDYPNDTRLDQCIRSCEEWLAQPPMDTAYYVCREKCIAADPLRDYEQL